MKNNNTSPSRNKIIIHSFLQNEIDKWEIKTMNELYNIEDLKTQNDDLQVLNKELQSQFSFYLFVLF